MIRSKNTLLEGRITRLEKTVAELKEEVLYIEARSMRDNLVFFNVPEHAYETSWADTMNVLKDFITEEMKMSDDDLQTLKIIRAHRTGMKGDRPRGIVAKLGDSETKSAIFKHAKNLDKRKKYGVSEQLPRELNERKKQLLPKFKEAKVQEKKPRWNVDKLVIDKTVTAIEKDCVRDINTNIEDAALQMKATRCPPKMYNGSTFQGHKVSIRTQDDIIPALHTIWADTRVARATHTIYAYRLANPGGQGVEHYEDDGEWGAGRQLLKTLQDTNTTNVLLCVTRWCGKKLLGKARFDHIEEAGTDVLVKNWANDITTNDLQSTTFF